MAAEAAPAAVMETVLTMTAPMETGMTTRMTTTPMMMAEIDSNDGTPGFYLKRTAPIPSPPGPTWVPMLMVRGK